MAQDMMSKMLENVVDYVLKSTGQTKEQVAIGINQFLQFGAYAHGALQRIEHNQMMLIEAENERRAIEGRPLLANVYNGSGPNGTRIVNGDGGGSNGASGGDSRSVS